MTGPLVGPEELAALLGRVTVLDVRYRTGGPAGPEEHAAGHVPGAPYVDLDTALAAPPGPRGRHPLPPTAGFETAMRAVGVSDGRPVVVYDDWSGHAAARCWWLLRFHGHRDVRVLDGGWSAWTAAGLPVETGAPVVEPGDFTAVPGGLPVVTAEEVPAVGVLVDARAPERYRGETEPLDPVAGHVPGAVNVPTSRNLTADGRFRGAEELRALYAEVGAVPGADVAAYCGSGVTAALDVLAMEVAGIQAALYPGSWSEWVADPARPVATGASPAGDPR
ncbi:sulfurtransferase [Nocardioides sp. TF02-7]|uniref:sulfurtransferase n=1 Tax=Nocardioides sp. TF02-7 TaxID=2917724 RepID=UPI001F05B13A|nr:sulfurtransferase [Nocardioides sp. TF02-7]UMG92172.1 sulfurtransferase [Nocardioides sp. TF02-7]